MADMIVRDFKVTQLLKKFIDNPRIRSCGAAITNIGMFAIVKYFKNPLSQ